MELPRLADTIEVLPDPFGNADTYITPDVTIDTVELVYFTASPLYGYDMPDAALKDGYIQPAWHFIGHYSTGDVIDVVVQALRMKYLSPDTSPGNPPG
jgi:hypothetical protein